MNIHVSFEAGCTPADTVHDARALCTLCALHGMYITVSYKFNGTTVLVNAEKVVFAHMPDGTPDKRFKGLV